MSAFRTKFDELCRAKGKALGRKLVYAEVLDLGEEAHLVVTGTKGKPAPVPRKRNELLDELIRLCGGDPEHTTKSEFRTAAVALSEMQTASPGLTVEGLRERVATYHRTKRDWALTPMSLAKWWSHLSPSDRAKTASEKRDIYVEPDGWRPLLQRLYDLSPEGIRDKQWLDLSPETRREVLKKMPA